MDAFIDGIDADQYQRWLAYIAVEPQGWSAFQHLIRRTTYFTAQVNSTKRLDERKFELSLVPNDPAAKARESIARAEAMSIRDAARASAERQVTHGQDD